MEDGIILAEILLFSTLYHNLKQATLLDHDGNCVELQNWKSRWNHLLGKKSNFRMKYGIFQLTTFFARVASPKANVLRLSHEFSYLVLARRSFEISRAAESRGASTQSRDSDNGASHSLHQDEDAQLFSGLAHKYALSTTQIFLRMPGSLIQELPKFHHICIAYCALVLSEYDEERSGTGTEEVLEVLQALRSHYSRFCEEVPAAMNFAVDKVIQGVKNKSGSVGGSIPAMGSGWTTSQEFPGQTASQNGVWASHNRIFNSFEPEIYHETTAQGMGNSNFVEGTQFPSFLTVEDFFGGMYSDLGSEYPYNV